MARPAVLQYLKHGKALCGKVFRNFVETFNHLVDVTENIKGDADLPGAKKGIKIDRANPSAPIIRLVGDFGGGGGDGGNYVEDIRLSPDGTYIQALIGGEWKNKIQTVIHSQVN